MTLGPILPGRLPNSFAAERLAISIQSTRADIQRLNDQLVTGQQYQVPSEDPASALRTLLLQKRLERKQQFQVNVQNDRSLLSATENSLSSINDTVNRAKSFVLQGIGDSVSDTARQGLATEVGALVRQAINAANSQFRGRYLFGGSETESAPFELTGNGAVRYSGDRLTVESFLDFDLLAANNVDGDTAFNALTSVDGGDLNVALTLDTRLDDLNDELGVESGAIEIVLDDGSNFETRSVDLTGAETVNDVKARIEDAFAGASITLTVDIDPASASGLRLTPSAGTVEVSDVTGSSLASDLGIASPATGQIIGSDLNPRLTIHSRIADLNGGTGIGATAGNGLLISNGDQSGVVDLDGLDTIGDLFNTLRLSGLDVDAVINESGNGVEVVSRLSGGQFSIGENNGNNATALGLRTLDGETVLSELNLGVGVQIAFSDELDIPRRDGSAAALDLTSAGTVQDVLDAINAVDPGNLVASLATVGNGITITDNSGTGPLSIASNSVSTALGLAGTESGSDPSVALVGTDVNPRESQGIISILSSLEVALRDGNDQELTRLNGLLDAEAERFLQVQGELGTRIRTLDEVDNRLQDEEVALNVDLAETLTALIGRQQSLEATFRVASETFRLNLLSFI